MSITKREREFFECLTSDNANLVLVETKLFGVDVTAICLLEEQTEDRLVQPLAIIVNDKLFNLLEEPKPDKKLGKVIIKKKKKKSKNWN